MEGRPVAGTAREPQRGAGLRATHDAAYLYLRLRFDSAADREHALPESARVGIQGVRQPWQRVTWHERRKVGCATLHAAFAEGVR